jgi:hypothetical protein
MGMKKIAIGEATAEQLREFATVALGLELGGRENKQMLAGKIAEAWAQDHILISDAKAPIPTGGPSPVGGAFNRRPREAPGGEEGEFEVRIVIQTTDRPGGDEPVPVGVNGRMMWIPRGEPVWVPEKYVAVLNAAEEHVFEEYKEGLGGLKKPRAVKSYPFSYA